MKSRQELFDTIATHLLTQNEKAVIRSDYSNSCVYRYTNAAGKVLKCAVGCLIPDDRYQMVFDHPADDVAGAGTTITANEPVQAELRHQGVDPADFMFLRILQMLHDHNEPHTWPTLLIDHARLYSLSPAVVDARIAQVAQ